MTKFYSNGKLLLTGEYLVLDGAKSLGLPTKKGQSLSIQSIRESKLLWESFDLHGERWLQVEFDLPKLRILSETFDSQVENGYDSLALKLQEVLTKAKELNKNFLANDTGWYVKTHLDFPRNWGLGTSSTLINNVAQWAQVDAFELQFKTFGGSAYDIACAQNNTPILYQLLDKKPAVQSVDFNPNFKGQLYFIYLNRKQNSREGIITYEKFKGNKGAFVEEASVLTDEILNSKSLTDFEKILAEHERIISSIINQRTVQQELFSDYFGQTKSLGAWGGDFIVATGTADTPNYFNRKGFNTVIPYEQMVL